MATDRFGQPIITKNLTGATRTPFADNLRNRYGSGTPMLGNRFNVDFTHPGTALQPGGNPRYGGYGDLHPGGGASGMGTGVWGTDTAKPVSGGALLGGGRFNQDVGGGGTMQPYQPGLRPAAGTMSPYQPVPRAPLNNLTPRFDPTQDNPWGRSGNLNTGLHGLLAQLLGGGRR
jgi:hypothetical protein